MPGVEFDLALAECDLGLNTERECTRLTNQVADKASDQNTNDGPNSRALRSRKAKETTSNEAKEGPKQDSGVRLAIKLVSKFLDQIGIVFGCHGVEFFFRYADLVGDAGFTMQITLLSRANKYRPYTVQFF